MEESESVIAALRTLLVLWKFLSLIIKQSRTAL